MNTSDKTLKELITELRINTNKQIDILENRQSVLEEEISEIDDNINKLYDDLGKKIFKLMEK